jgi:hypothetical protein
MLLLIDIDDDKAGDFVEMMKSYSYLKAKSLSVPDAKLLKEISEIKTAFKHAGQIKAGKLNGRPAEELFNEL